MVKKTQMLQSVEKMIDRLIEDLEPLEFASPVKYVYNPVGYARTAHLTYWRRYGLSEKKVLFLGMNPGPFGMVQTGIPFGDRSMVVDWLGIQTEIGHPEKVHPKRPVQGFECSRREVSGQRLWGWACKRFITPDRFFKRFFVTNYCPLVFIEESGRNRTPDKLPRKEKETLFAVCDEALVKTIDLLHPETVIGVGKFAFEQAQRALRERPVQVGRISHPSPANPIANAGWSTVVEEELAALGIR